MNREQINIYTIPTPDFDGRIEVYGEPEMCWYEWRVIEGDLVIRDTADGLFGGRQYGSAEYALRDALIFATGLESE